MASADIFFNEFLISLQFLFAKLIKTGSEEWSRHIDYARNPYPTLLISAISAREDIKRHKIKRRKINLWVMSARS